MILPNHPLPLSQLSWRRQPDETEDAWVARVKASFLARDQPLSQDREVLLPPLPLPPPGRDEPQS